MARKISNRFIGESEYKTNMPIYDDVLSDEEIVAVLSYIKSRWPSEIQDRHDQMNANNAKANQ
jgi:mono/diheme cytochrome c family protein